MTYLGCDSKRRVLPVVTFVLISYLFSGELVCARPQDILSSRSADNDTKEIVAEKVELINNSTLNDRHGQPIVVEQSIKIHTSEHNASLNADGAKVEQKLYGDISVDSGLDFGRSAEASTSKPMPTVNTLKPLPKIGVTPISATDMVAADIRTPPKIKSQIVHSQMQSLLSPGKGEAIPVVLEGNDDAALEKISSDNFKYTHSDATPSSGLSTWILLNSDSVSTPYSHFKKGQKPTTSESPNTTSSENVTDSKKKPLKSTTTTTTTTTEKLIKSKIEAVVMKKPERKPIATIQKVNQTVAKKPLVSKIEPEEIPMTTTVVSLQDSKFKNKTPVVVGKVPSTSFKEQVINNTTPMTFVELPTDNNTRKGTPVVTFPHVPVRQKQQNSSTTRKPFTTNKPSVMILSSSTSIKSNLLPEISTVPSSSTTNLESFSAITEETQSEAITETTTKKSSSGSKKKKKKNKNKNKRRRPTKKPAKIQSKISEDDNSTSKLPMQLTTGAGNKPISTRIYNYLAREVMPNVGVGIMGLMLTAGLAGLLLYPFGGAVPVRRNYEKPGPPSYNLNDYPPANEVDNAQPEESVLSQVLAGMSNTMNQYSREQPDVPYKSHQKYKPARFDNPNTYNHHKDLKYTTETIMEDSKFSELGDVVSGPHESVKFTSFDINDSIKYPIDGPPPSPSYSTIDLTTGQNDPVYHKYSPPSDPVKHEGSVYSTLGEYASYSNPHEPMQNPVYNGDAYDYKNHKNDQNTQDFKVNSDLEVGTQSPENQTTTVKVKHEQPSFAALEGIPKNYRTLQTSIRFEDTASVLPLNQDFVPSDGIFAASIEHGPRNMRLRRRKRDISSENEIDSILIDTTEKPSETSQPSVQFITETTTGLPPSTEESTTKLTTESVELNVTSTEDLKILNSSSSAENIVESFDTKNKSEPIIMVMPENLPTPVSESSPQFVPIHTIQKVEGQPANNCENCSVDLSHIEEHPAPPQPFSLGKLFRKILDFKFRIGFELIRATTDVISQYLSTVQQRMTEALRDLQRSAFRMNDDKKSRTNVIKKRERRHIVHGS